MVTCFALMLADCKNLGKQRKASPTPTQNKNVILISIDTLRADELGCYGSIDGLTPTLDLLAKMGALFTHAQATAPWTLPSHASMLTGLYPFAHRAIDGTTALSNNLFYLPDFLSKKGFATAGFVSVEYVGEQYGFNRGMGTFEKLDDPPAKEILGKAQEWIQAQDDRYFCFVHLFSPHEPYSPTPELIEQYAPSCPKNVGPFYLRNGVVTRNRRALQCRRELYRAEIAGVDKALGRFLRNLKKAGLMDDTLLIVTSDHGEGFLEHGYVGHVHSLFQEVLAVPLIIAGKGIPKNVRTDAPVSHVDLVPTILTWLGYPLTMKLQGIHLFNEAQLIHRRAVFSMVFHDPFAALASFDGRYKYIEFPRVRTGNEIMTSALYDLSSDPKEQTNRIKLLPTLAWNMRERIFGIEEITARRAYFIRYFGTKKLNRIGTKIVCDDPITACDVLFYHNNPDPRDPLHYVKTKTYFNGNQCAVGFEMERSPDTLFLIPGKPEGECRVKFHSEKLDERTLTTRIYVGNNQKALEPATVFPIGDFLSSELRKDSIAVGEGGILTLKNNLDIGQTDKRVELDDKAKARLRSLGYLH